MDSAGTAPANSTVTGKYLNDSPSPIFFDDNTRFVIYNGWQANYTNYRLCPISAGLPELNVLGRVIRLALVPAVQSGRHQGESEAGRLRRAQMRDGP